MEMLKIYVDGETYEIAQGTTLEQIAKEYEKKPERWCLEQG